MKVILGLDKVKYPMSGIGVYSYNLCRELLKYDQFDLFGLNRYKLLEKSELKGFLDSACLVQLASDDSILQASKSLMQSALKDLPLTRSIHHLSSKLASAYQMKNLSDDAIYHVPNFIGYGSSPNKVITIHDLSHIDCPEMHPKSRVDFMNNNLPVSLREAKHIVVDSEFTRQRLFETGLVDANEENKVTKVYLGVSDEFSDVPDSNDQNFLSRFNLFDKRYLLSLGTLEPRKNYQRLVDAYLSLPREVAAEFPLVICGAKGWKYEELLRKLSSIKLPYRVILTGHLHQNEMVQLLRKSRVFIYPSLYEGFGMPILEAMKSGVPVITSNFGAMLEISGDAAIHVDPLSKGDISKAIIKLIESPTVCSELIKLGFLNANKFTWKKCASETVGVYKAI